MEEKSRELKEKIEEKNNELFRIREKTSSSELNRLRKEIEKAYFVIDNLKKSIGIKQLVDTVYTKADRESSLRKSGDVNPDKKIGFDEIIQKIEKEYQREKKVKEEMKLSDRKLKKTDKGESGEMEQESEKRKEKADSEEEVEHHDLSDEDEVLVVKDFDQSDLSISKSKKTGSLSEFDI